MAVDARIRELTARHHDLDDLIASELQSPSSDDLKIQSLKRQKLKLKEEIENLRQRRH